MFSKSLDDKSSDDKASGVFCYSEGWSLIQLKEVLYKWFCKYNSGSPCWEKLSVSCMLSLSHCETMLNSVKGKENVKKKKITSFFFFLNPKTALQCVYVLGVEFRSAAFRHSHSSLQTGKQVLLK